MLFFHLGSVPLQSWDEAIYAESAKEMVISGDYLTPHWNQEKFFHKPPLTIWATAFLFRVFGVNETTARSFSALTGIGCILLTLFIGRLFLHELSAFLASLILLVSPAFYYLSRTGMMDVPLTFFLLLALYAFLKTKDSPRWWILTGVGCGLAVMTKGPAALPVLIAIAMALLIERKQTIGASYLWLGGAAFLFVAGTWHLVMIYLHGWGFVDEYVGRHILMRTATTLEYQSGGFWYYPKYIAIGFSPFSPLVVLSVLQFRKYRQVPIALFCFAAAVLSLYMIVSTKEPQYVLPILPVLALLVATTRRYTGAFYAILIIIGLIVSVHMSSVGLNNYSGINLRAREDTGPIQVDMVNAPSVLFYTDRRVCAESDHSMGLMTKCSIKPTNEIVSINGELVYKSITDHNASGSGLD